MKLNRFDVIVVHSLDRWSRNLAITLQTFKDISDHRVAFVSVGENIDYSTPEGRLFIAMLGAFAQYSDSLAKQTKKGMRERAIKGYHLGGIPFGFVVCECHEAGVHQDQQEATAVAQLFQMYASGSYTQAQLAKWMNEQGFVTRNTKTMQDAHGSEVTGPRKFTLYSVGGILRNPFFAGSVAHGKELYPGKHEAFVSKELFDTVQQQLQKAKGQRHTTGPSYRTYLLKGLIRCVWCGLPVWGETLWHGKSYYRERKMARSEGICDNEGKMIRTEILDEQVGKIIESIELDPSWERRMAAIIDTLDQRAQLESERNNLEQKLRRLAKAYVDGFVDEGDYEFQQRVAKSQLESLVIPEERSTLQAGHLLEDLPLLWKKANPEERHTVLNGFLDCVYVDMEKPGTLVGIKPKPQFLELLSFVNTNPDSGVELQTKSSESQIDPEPDMTGWWRRGRVELPVHPRLAYIRGAGFQQPHSYLCGFGRSAQDRV